jgi:hypothetical protein
MKTATNMLVRLFGIVAIACFSGCTPAEDSVRSGQAGKPCVIQFRRDALGAAASLPISPLVQGINGASTSVSGTYQGESGDWISVRVDTGTVWIARSSILLIEFK